MIVYNETKAQFNQDVVMNQISDKILASLHAKNIHAGEAAEYRSWQNSLGFMRNVLDDPAIPDYGSAASTGTTVFVQLEQEGEKMPRIATISDAIKPGDAVTITGNNLMPNSDLQVAYAPSVDGNVKAFDENKTLSFKKILPVNFNKTIEEMTNEIILPNIDEVEKKLNNGHTKPIACAIHSKNSPLENKTRMQDFKKWGL